MSQQSPDKNERVQEPVKQRSLQELLGQSGLLIGSVVVLFLGVVIFAYLFLFPHFNLGGATKDQPLPKLEPTSQLRGTDLSKFQESYGPWLSTSEAEKLRAAGGVRNLALFRGNGLVYSAKSVKFDPGQWTQSQTPPEITGVDVRGSVLEVRTQKGNRYVLNVTQPFVLEGELTRVYVVDKNRKLWSVQISALAFVNAADAADTQLPVNPELSLSIGS